MNCAVTDSNEISQQSGQPVQVPPSKLPPPIWFAVRDVSPTSSTASSSGRCNSCSRRNPPDWGFPAPIKHPY